MTVYELKLNWLIIFRIYVKSEIHHNSRVCDTRRGCGASDIFHFPQFQHSARLARPTQSDHVSGLSRSDTRLPVQSHTEDVRKAHIQVQDNLQAQMDVKACAWTCLNLHHNPDNTYDNLPSDNSAAVRQLQRPRVEDERLYRRHAQMAQ